jgi:hypothetical protein
LVTDLPVALAFQHVESFFLNTMNVEASGKAGWQRPFEHRSVLGIFSGYEERQRLAGQCDSFGFARHSNNSFWAHNGPHHYPAVRESLEFVPKLLRNISEGRVLRP